MVYFSYYKEPTCYPLNSISIVNSKIGENLNFIGIWDNIPILVNLTLKNFTYDFSLYCLLQKKINNNYNNFYNDNDYNNNNYNYNNHNNYDFENHMNKIIHGSEIKNFPNNFFNNYRDNNNNYIDDSNFYFQELIPKFTLNENNKNDIDSDNNYFNGNEKEENFQIFFTRNFSEKFSIFLIIFQKKEKILNSFKLKISNDNYIFKNSEKDFKRNIRRNQRKILKFRL